VVDASKRLSSGDFRLFGDIFFAFHSTVRTALTMEPDTDSTGRKYVHCMLCRRTPDNPGPGETLGETLERKGFIYLFDDGSFGNALPEERKEEKREAKEEESNTTEQPKKKGLLGKLFG
jgi:hypothetical protein